MNRVRVINWENIYLAVPEKKDAELRFKNLNDLEVQQYLSIWWNIMTLEWEEQFYEESMKNPNKKLFVICSKDVENDMWNIITEENIWTIELNINQRHRNWELWIVIFNKEYRNKWYWTESIKLMISYWFDVLGLHKIFLHYIDYNWRWEKVYNKCWFREVWVRKEHWYLWWEYHDIVEMEILRSEYLGLKEWQ
jgi:RimJ/RimL family protein N-acetyltransferase